VRPLAVDDPQMQIILWSINISLLVLIVYPWPLGLGINTLRLSEQGDLIDASKKCDVNGGPLGRLYVNRRSQVELTLDLRLSLYFGGLKVNLIQCVLSFFSTRHLSSDCILLTMMSRTDGDVH